MPSLSGYYNRGIQTDEAGAAVNSQPYWASEERIAAIGVEAARSEQFDAYVKDLGGKKPIRKVLIANNGIGAVKAIRSIRRWSYNEFGYERMVKFVVMATPDDIAAAAEYIKLADAFCEVTGGTNNQNYANVSLIIDIAERYECDGVWAGWGHASENPALPQGLVDATGGKIAFMGPAAGPMAALGDKIASTLIAQSVGVSCVGWSGSGLTVDFKGDGKISEEIFEKSCVRDADDAVARGDAITYPIMVKASEGGGGKGIRVVTQKSEMKAAYRQVAGEVPGSPIFLMKMMSGARHLEVQLIADQYGEAIALSGRDCSVQRRHQKIIEEAPQVCATPETWDKMMAAAVALAKEVHYESAGTVEYLYVPESDTFFFLELNPRLQVEHPCTEWITDCNLPSLQLSVAMGIPLGRMPDIRRFHGFPEFGTPAVDFTTAKHTIHGHVVAGRITAENPDEGFKPTSGSITEITFRNTPHVWGYFSTYNNIHAFSDSQFGHLFAWGINREAARHNMVCALKELDIRGDIRTSVEYLTTLMEMKDFRENEISTQWLDGLIANKVQSARPDIFVSVICAALFKATQAEKEIVAGIHLCLEKGQIPIAEDSFNAFPVELILDDVKYALTVYRRGSTLFQVETNGSSVWAEMRSLNDGGLHICVDGESHVVFAKDEPSALSLKLDKKTVRFSKEYDPTSIETDTAGKLVRYLVADGAHVNKGDEVVEMEVMKMFLTCTAPESGILTTTMLDGTAIDTGDVIAKLELDDPSMVRKAVLFTDRLPAMQAPVQHGRKMHQKFRAVQERISNVLAGYQAPDQELYDSFKECALSPVLGLSEFTEELDILNARLPKSLTDKLHELIKAGMEAPDKEVFAKLKDAIGECGKLLDAEAVTALEVTWQPLLAIASKHAAGALSFFVDTCVELLGSFVAVEGIFQSPRVLSYEEMIYMLRTQTNGTPVVILEHVVSHHNAANKHTLALNILKIMDEVIEEPIASFTDLLATIASWGAPASVAVSRCARDLALKYDSMSLERMVTEIETSLAAISVSEGDERAKNMRDLADNSDYLSNTLLGFVFSSAEQKVRVAAVQAYVRRIFKAQVVSGWSDTLIKGAAGDVLTTQWICSHVDQERLRALSPRRGMKRVNSATLLTGLMEASAAAESKAPISFGQIAVLDSCAALGSSMEAVLTAYAANEVVASFEPTEDPKNILGFIVDGGKDAVSEEEWITDVRSTLAEYDRKLRECGIRTVNVVLVRAGHDCGFFSFTSALNFAENAVCRHIDSEVASELELDRLSLFSTERFPSNMDHVFAFKGEAETDSRIFARSLVRNESDGALLEGDRFAFPAVEKVFKQTLTILEDALSADTKGYERTHMNHVFLNMLTTLTLPEDDAENVQSHLLLLFKRMCKSRSKQLDKLRVTDVEIRLMVKQGMCAQTVRIMVSNPSARFSKAFSYKEVGDAVGNATTLVTINTQPGSKTIPGPLEHKLSTYAYTSLDTLQRKRLRAAVLGTTYVHDFPELFQEGLRTLWLGYLQGLRRAGKGGRIKMPPALMEVQELSLTPEGVVVPRTAEEARSTSLAMVGWRFKFYSPECPLGREVIMIANDITVAAGSFGPTEDRFFDAVSKLARAEGLPRIYLAANSGARIGLAEEVRSCFEVDWVDAADVAKGFNYIYLKPEDYARLNRTESEDYKRVGARVGGKSVNATKIEVDGEERWKIDDVIGTAEGLGVESLAGSAMIAGETSRAYDEIFTLTYVSSRSVGIGAYLVRLGQRVIQKTAGAPIILTGFGALNKLLGRPVYSSNEQLGGTRVMHNNGVTQLTVENDFDGAVEILKWLAFVPATNKSPLPILEVADPITRTIDFRPTAQYDVRAMLAGAKNEAGDFVSGFFDSDTWIETLDGWAQNVVTGRARLGGIPIGAIAVEMRTIDKVLPADPADPETKELVQPQAAQVWFPDSSYKTASAISDFNREGLPLMVFANWRGFSGGTRDMFDEILKFGSMIVDQLVDYKQPVFIYIPRDGTLRGGAWVVVDPNINPAVMEMYADTAASGGVLEAEGTVQVKFRRPKLIATMHRLDDELVRLDREIASGSAAAPGLVAQITAREKELLPLYSQIAVRFAELHDTSGRMKGKGVIRDIVAWPGSREYFYWRLRRKLEEFSITAKLKAANPNAADDEVCKSMKGWLSRYQNLAKGEGEAGDAAEGEPATDSWEDDRLFLEWVDSDREEIERRVASWRRRYIADLVYSLGVEDEEALKDGLRRLGERAGK